jgi:hypothetical protein
LLWGITQTGTDILSPHFQSLYIFSPYSRYFTSNPLAARITASTISFYDNLLATLASTLEKVLLLALPELLDWCYLQVVVAERDVVVAALAAGVDLDDLAAHGCCGVEIYLSCWLVILRFW